MATKALISSLFILLFCLQGCAVRAYRVTSPSMSPTINPGDGLISDNLSDELGKDFKRFEIVVFDAPSMEVLEPTLLTSRIVALPGEIVEISNGKVLINGEELKQDFDVISSEDSFGPLKVPPGQYFMLGDNRPHSFDSRYFEPSTIKKENIRGRIVEILSGYYR